jgi:hypothetical protein
MHSGQYLGRELRLPRAARFNPLLIEDSTSLSVAGIPEDIFPRLNCFRAKTSVSALLSNLPVAAARPYSDAIKREVEQA